MPGSSPGMKSEWSHPIQVSNSHASSSSRRKCAGLVPCRGASRIHPTCAVIRGLRVILVSLSLFLCAAFPPLAYSQESPSRLSESATTSAPLPKGRSALNDMFVPLDRRLGRFDIDLGLSPPSDRLTVQTNYMMANISSVAISKKIITASGRRCSMVLSPSSYPLIEAYMTMTESSASRDQVTRICVDEFLRIFTTVENDESSITAAIDDLKARDNWANGSSATPRLRGWRAISEAVRRIYVEDGAVHALLSVRYANYAAVTFAHFQEWIQEVRRSHRIRFLSDDPTIAPEADIFERNTHVWREMDIRRKSTALIEVNDWDSADVRAAVLVAIELPADGKIRNDVVEKYCRGKWNSKVDASDKTLPRCRFETVFHQEGWIEFYYSAEDGAGESLRRLAADLAQDPAVLALAAMKRNDGKVGHPYLVFFGH